MRQNDAMTSGAAEPPPRILLDTSTYRINNIGDIAMLKVLVGRIFQRYPEARIRVLTNDPTGVLQLDPRLEPLIVGDRQEWRAVSFGPTDAREGLPITAARQLDRVLRATAPDEYWALVAELSPDAALNARKWTEALGDSDAVILTGGGYFTDVFAQHAVGLLETIAGALNKGLPTFIVSCGFEPTTDAELQEIARETLPWVTHIACREGTTSTEVLRSLGVDPRRFVVTGDDAIEIAYTHRPHTIGSSIAVNLREHSYNRLDDLHFEACGKVLQEFADAHHANLLPAPISLFEPNDMEAIRRLRIRTGEVTSITAKDVKEAPRLLIKTIRAARLTITGSYHAAVFSLAIGIPAVCLTRSEHYQRKMTGLLDIFGSDSVERVISLDNHTWPDALGIAIENAWQQADRERASLLQAAERQVELGKRSYASIFSAIESHLGSRATNGPRADAPKAARAAPRLDRDAALGVLMMLGSALRQRRSLESRINDLTHAVAAERTHAQTLESIAAERLNLIHSLRQIAEKRLVEIETLKAASDERLMLVDELHRTVYQQQRLIEELQTVAEERLAAIHHIDSAANERLLEIEALRTTATDRLEEIERLKSAADERLQAIELLESARVDRQSVVEQLHTIAADRLKAIDELTSACASWRAVAEQYEAVADERLRLIAELSREQDTREQAFSDLEGTANQRLMLLHEMERELENKEHAIETIRAAAEERLLLIQRLEGELSASQSRFSGRRQE
jgi:colanic acid/amylovoran biosynthesis protein